MTGSTSRESRHSSYITFSREEWARLRDVTPQPLTEGELERLRALNERISLEEVAHIYLPLSRLLNLHAGAAQQLYRATDAFLGGKAAKVPYIIGIAGSVAVGKSTTARILQALLARWPNHPKVDLVTTDGFLYPNRVLEERGIMKRKGFPESYDIRRLIRFLSDVKSGCPEVSVPVYSHLVYDIVPNETQLVRQPDIVIVEGLNVLQVAGTPSSRNTPPLFVSDFFDFSIYVDAPEELIFDWYVDRMRLLRETAFRSPQSYFHRYSRLSEEEAVKMAREVWTEINGVNLRENIAPTKGRARLILEKGADHAVQRVRLKKL
jgi:type I pantothenate kinase